MLTYTTHHEEWCVCVCVCTWTFIVGDVGRSTNGMLQGILVHWCHDPQPLGVQNKETPQFDLWEHPKPFTKSY